MGEYRLSVLAEQDLDDILDYTWEAHGERQAQSYADDIKTHLTMLADNPKLAAERSEFDPPVRLYPSGKHIIAYLDQGNHIWVVRLLHQRMDIRRYL